MNKPLLTTFVCFIGLMVQAVAQARPLTPEDLYSDDRIQSFSISPSGKYIAYVSPNNDNDIFTVAELDGMKPTFTTQMGPKRFVMGYRWVNDERLLLWPGERWGVYENIYWTGEMQAFNYDGKKNTKLWGYGKELDSSGESDPRRGYLSIENTLEDDPEHILVVTKSGQWGTYTTRRLRKMNVYNGRLTRGERSSIRRASFITDKKGNNIGQLGTDDKYETIFVYKNDKGELEPIPDGKSVDSVWVNQKGNFILTRAFENNVYKLVEFDRQTKKEKVLRTSKGADISPMLDRDDLIFGYSLIENGKRARYYFDNNHPEAQLRLAVANAFKNYSTSVSDGSKDGTKRIVTVYSDVEPGKHYLYNANAKVKLQLINLRRQKIKRDRFSKMTPVKFKARDGLEINGYLTRPNGSKGKDPMVVMVHGGPYGVRDYWGYNSEVQLLASQGYAVLQVNFRGSGGYGKAFEEAGHLQWGKAMQDDVTDGTLWAVKQGFADKDKLCIYGASYGGYAALWGVVKEPDLYKCAIGYVGVYDLPLENSVGDINDTREGRHFLETTRGTDETELRKYSPVHNASKIKAGLFLVHGGEDERVPIEHYENMTEALDNLKYPYESMVMEGEGHGFAETENQYKLYNKMVRFLAKYLK